MTANDFISAGIEINDNATSMLYAEAALDWIEYNTKIEVNRMDLSTLPAGAKLFIIKYGDVMKSKTNVTSQSLGGMSQSFSSATKSDQLYDLAYELIGLEYMVSQVKFIAAQSRWA